MSLFTRLRQGSKPRAKAGKDDIVMSEESETHPRDSTSGPTSANSRSSSLSGTFASPIGNDKFSSGPPEKSSSGPHDKTSSGSLGSGGGFSSGGAGQVLSGPPFLSGHTDVSSGDAIGRAAAPVVRVVELDSTGLVEQIARPIRARTTVALPHFAFRAADAQCALTLEAIEERVGRAGQAVDAAHAAAAELSARVNLLIEKASDMHQSAANLVAKVSVTNDWISALENTGSGLKMQFFTWVVQFLTLLSALFIFMWRAVQRLNPFGRRRKQPTAAFERRPADEDDDES
jgi:hypothetical protein